MLDTIFDVKFQFPYVGIKHGSKTHIQITYDRKIVSESFEKQQAKIIRSDAFKGLEKSHVTLTTV